MSIWLGIGFAIIALAILLVGHYFIYYSLISLFKLTDSYLHGIIIAALIILPISFVVSTVIAHWKENWITKTFYFASGMWLGISANLILGFLAAWVVVGFFKIIGLTPNTIIIGTVAVVLALLYVAYGIYNVYNPEIVQVYVKIKNLPEEWKGKTAVQISDVHLGHILGQNFLKKVVNQINEINPDIVFITGDLFDGMEGSLDFSVKPLDDIKAPKGVYFATGNHETYFGTQKVFDILKKTKVQVLDDQMIVVDGLQIIGISYPEKMARKDLDAAIKNIHGYDPNGPSVLLWHNPIQIEEAKSSGIKLQLSGHTHRGQIFPVGIITRLIYGPYNYGLDSEGDFNLYTSSGVGVWGPTMRTGASAEIVVIHLQ